MQATETAVDIALNVSKKSHRNVCSEVFGKLLPASMGFANCSELKFYPDFHNTHKRSL